MQTSPVLACRRSGSGPNIRGSIGFAIPGTTLKVVDPETFEEVPDGEQGLILAKGPGVMRGYLNDPKNTHSAMRAGGGFFDTGDLGWRAPGDCDSSIALDCSCPVLKIQKPSSTCFDKGQLIQRS